MDIQASETETPAATLQYNVTGTRIIAALIDIVILVALFALMAVVFGDAGTTSEDGGASFHVNLTGAPFLLFLAAQLAYYVLFEALFAGTVGKLVIGLRIVKMDGSPYGWSSALIRNLLRFVDGLPVFYLVGIIAVAATEKNQRLGDMAAGTLVVRAP